MTDITIDIDILTEENNKLQDKVTCKSCMEKHVSAVFAPCGHLIYCSECAPAFKFCPICYTEVKMVIPVNLK